MTTENIKKLVREGKYKLLRNESFDDYIYSLEEELQEAKNTRDDADGVKAERYVEIDTNDGSIIKLMGSEKNLATGWKVVTEKTNNEK